MQSFQNITSLVMPLPLKDIDTDMIIPAEFLRSTTKEGYGEHVFKRLRDQDPDFPLNLEQYQDAKILLTLSNFGCGSSREHAVWAIMDFGIRVIIAPSFADIFKNNAPKNGLVLIELDHNTIDTLIQKSQKDGLHLLVDLQKQTVIYDQKEYHFDFDPFRKECILKGYDDLDYILSDHKKIKQYQKQQDKRMFYSTLKTNN